MKDIDLQEVEHVWDACMVFGQTRWYGWMGGLAKVDNVFGKKS